MPPIVRPPKPPPAERDVLAEIRLALGQEPDLVLWRLSQGAGLLVRQAALRQIADYVRDGCVVSALQALDNLANGRFERLGLVPGAADLIGVLSVHATYVNDLGKFIPQCGIGRFFALEVKRPAAKGRSRGRTSEQQDQWMAIVRNLGGFAAAVSGVDEAKDALRRARMGAPQ